MLENHIEVSELHPGQLEGKSFSVASGGLKFPCRYLPYPGSRLLIVMLHGSFDRETGIQPIFARWNWGKILRANILSIDDPTLYLNDRLSNGWYIGTKDSDVIPGLVKISQTIASRLGLLYSQIVFYGSGSAGFAAISAAANCSASCVAINPVTDLAQQDQEQLADFAEVFAPSSSSAQNHSAFPTRWSAIEAVLAARRAGRSPRILIMQNVMDASSYEQHYLPLCRALKVPHEGGIGFHGQVMSATYSDDSGRETANTPSVVSRIIAEGFSFLKRLHFSDVNQVELGIIEGQAFVVEHEGVGYPCRYMPHKGSDLLYVVLHAAVNRGKEALPLYARWNWGKVLRGNILSIDDPTLYLDDQLRLSWYIGTREKDVIKGLVKIAEIIAGQLNIPASRIIFYGTSGGGFAAIAAAALCSSSAVAINPQTDVALYNTTAVAEFAQVFDQSALPAQSRAAFPERWSVIEAMRSARSAGRAPRVFLIQNDTNDFYTVKNHYLPFCEALNVPGEGGVGCDGLVMSMMYSDEAGHDAADTPEVVRRVVSEGITFLTDRHLSKPDIEPGPEAA